MPLKFTRSAKASFKCEPAMLYEVLTDYDTYADWAPLVSQSRLLAKEGELAIAELELIRPAGMKLAVECIHTTNRGVMIRSISSDAPFRKIDWEIEPDSPGTCTATLKIECSYRSLIAAARHFGQPAVWVEAATNRLGAFAAEFSVCGEGAEAVIEVSETPDGLICIFRGKKYILQAESETSA